ncbi:hypothetical protein [Marinicellulosiphila megalodicopiae]|uniref:hypothetical protein n=1 Tax=Marinicellulosiphila megalodicopiae TaxID=2724896 RepID=UPI003BB08C15
MSLLNVYSTDQIVTYALLFVTVIALLILWQSNRRQKQLIQLTNDQLEVLKQEIFIVNQGAIGVGKKLLKMQFQKAKPKVEKTHQSPNFKKSYNDQVNLSHAAFLKDELPSKKIELAHQLSEEGANNQKISQSLGFSFAEVQLIQSMHNH